MARRPSPLGARISRQNGGQCGPQGTELLARRPLCAESALYGGHCVRNSLRKVQSYGRRKVFVCIDRSKSRGRLGATNGSDGTPSVEVDRVGDALDRSVTYGDDDALSVSARCGCAAGNCWGEGLAGRAVAAIATCTVGRADVIETDRALVPES